MYQLRQCWQRFSESISISCAVVKVFLILINGEQIIQHF